VLAHPTRAEILRLLEPGRVASPTELSDEMGVPLPQLSYHVRRLAQLGAIEPVKTEVRRGAVEHFYRTCERPFYDNDTWADLSDRQRAGITRAFASAILQDIATAVATGSIDTRLDRHMTRTPLRLDEEAWNTLEPQLMELQKKAEHLQGEAANRIAAGVSEPINARLMLLFFELPAGAP
jgi:DNA-binding transcriptional ArsR family regulator